MSTTSIGWTKFDRRVFLGHRGEELSYRQLDEQQGASVHEIEQAMIHSLRVIAQAVDRKNRRRSQFWRR